MTDEEKFGKAYTCKYWALWDGMGVGSPEDPDQCANGLRWRHQKPLRTGIADLTWINSEKSMECPEDCKYFKEKKHG